MLEQLLIRNIALFEEAAIQFGPGLHVLTGETGAGKSLVVDAVNFLCGARTDRDFIRTDSDKAYVEGVFSVEGLPGLQASLDQMEVEPEDGRLILSREMNTKGRSLFRVNGLAVSLAVYQQLTALLVDLHGQHEHQSLLHESRHLHFLDLLGDAAHAALMQQTKEAFLAFSAARKALEQARQASADKAERMEILALRKKELREAKLVPGEEESLQAEKTMLRNADKMIGAINGVNAALFEGAGEETAGSFIRTALQLLEKIVDYQPAFRELHDRLTALSYELEEIGHDLNAQLRGISLDNKRLEQVEDRLDQLRKLQRKYGPTSEAMLQTLNEVESELRQYETLDEDLERLEAEAVFAEQAFVAAAGDLSVSRSALAQKYGKLMESALAELNMAGTRFQIRVERQPDLRLSEGMDKVSMLIAPNAGEELKPLAKIASGGELSRVMLAMKAMAAQKNEVPTMVFDEIDTGVSGHTALVIAQKLWDIGRFRQVICVSHLHQLAAMASSHYLVTKAEQGGRTRAAVQLLEIKEREREIAKMLGDLDTQGKSGLQHAKVLLEDGARYREKDNSAR